MSWEKKHEDRRLFALDAHIGGTTKRGQAIALPGSHALPTTTTPKAAPKRKPKVTRGPDWTHDPRYQCAPGEQPFGAGFAAAGPGRDITTGDAWVAKKD